jgi:putative ABC transport system permease protein
MRPEPPAGFRESWVERAGLKRFFSQPARIIFRSLQRHPGRAALSLVGIALGGALLIVGSFSMDSVDVMMDTQFNLVQRYDMMVAFVEPTSSHVLYDLRRLPGVLDVEPFRAVPVRLRFGHRSRNTSITGVAEQARLNRLVDASLSVIEAPPGGLVLSQKLAEILGVSRGDHVTVEVLEGQRPVRQVPVVRLIEEYMGINAYMRMDALHRMMREAGSLSGAYLTVDEAAADRLYRDLKNTPQVAGVQLKTAALESFNETLNEMMTTLTVINVAFAVIIAFGVVYNAARISLSERSRELATLRVIGFTRGEISYILLGELAVLTLFAVPLGMLLGYVLAAMMVNAFDLEVWRLPLVIYPQTYAFAATTIVAATVFSALIVRRKLDRLNLVEVLKTRE